ncbi:hypothetical protein ACWFMI_23205 [Nocardiopsis terrae]|uniref:hypothetical protein n=1 Tax=Streptomyces sp. NPDC057554 TaxID=3350538 RepID=UPI0036A927BD
MLKNALKVIERFLMEIDKVALDAAMQAWGDGPPLSPSALEAIRPIWIPAYRAALENSTKQAQDNSHNQPGADSQRPNPHGGGGEKQGE